MRLTLFLRVFLITYLFVTVLLFTTAQESDSAQNLSGILAAW
ncbi:exported hypothetical protein [Xenorhabdus innexi]|uniref:Uncharacterized protein n=1 Tax=Xenorhabdus innexi TaxID=290109 RepID=A0A1N6MUT5_9GAMM|nr:exported hypothetical protein [Xenorhabdus innexi]